MRIWQLHFELDKYDSIHLLPITGPELGNIGILAHSVEFEKPLFDTAAFLMASYLSEPVVSASDAPI